MSPRSWSLSATFDRRPDTRLGIFQAIGRPDLLRCRQQISRCSARVHRQTLCAAKLTLACRPKRPHAPRFGGQKANRQREGLWERLAAHMRCLSIPLIYRFPRLCWEKDRKSSFIS